MSVDFIPEIPGSQIQLRIAWGADLTDTSGATWTWTDVTTDVRFDPGISTSIGRNDEAASVTPAKLTCTLDNTASRYSLGGTSPNWPNVRRNVPVMLRLDLNDGFGFQVVFRGYAVGFTPEWEANGRIPIVKLEAAGVWRRLIQRKDPLPSALYRFHTIGRVYDQLPTDYWPLEEEKAAQVAASPIGSPDGQFQPLESAGLFYGKVDWGAETDLPGALRAVSLDALGTLSFTCRQSLYTPAAGVNCGIAWSMKITSDSGAFVRWHIGDESSGVFVYLLFYTDGSYELYRVDPANPGGLLLSSGDLGEPFEWDGVWRHYTLEMYHYANGTTGTALFLGVDGVAGTSAYLYGSTTVTYLAPRRVEFSMPVTDGPTSFSHLAVFNDSNRVMSATPLARLIAARRAHDGETAESRILRLCLEQGISIDFAELGSADLVIMGPQLPVALPDLLEECEVADQGALVDGLWYSDIYYIPRSKRENRASQSTIAAGDAANLAPIDDDQRILNRATVKTSKGAQYTAEDTTGPMGTDVVGLYDGGVDVNLSNAADAEPMAGWLLHLGTQEGYRYPELQLDLRATPALKSAALYAEPSRVVTLTDPSTVFEGIAPGDVRLLIEGISMQLSPRKWTVKLLCSAAAGWDIATIAAETGDTGLDSMRLRSGASTLSSGPSLGATSISVATSGGNPLWTTTADDFPLYLDVGGVQVRATASSGASSPQTFTVDALPQAFATSTPVDVWNPPVLGL